MPVTIPAVFMVAFAGFVLLQAPPVVIVLSAVVVPGQIVLPPVTAAGAASTVGLMVFENTGLAVTQPRLLPILQLTVLPFTSVLLVYDPPIQTSTPFSDHV
jgi:hypothetical protein